MQAFKEKWQQTIVTFLSQQQPFIISKNLKVKVKVKVELKRSESVDEDFGFTTL